MQRRRPVSCSVFRIGLVFASAMLPTAVFAHADSYPTKPIRVVIPFSAGTPIEVPARAVTQRMMETFGQSFVFDYHGIWFPAGTPQPTVRKIHGEFVKAIALPETMKLLFDGGLIPIASSPEEFAEFIRKDIVKQAEIVKQIRLAPQ